MFVLLRPVGLSCQMNCGYCYYKKHHEASSSKIERMDMYVVERLLVGLKSFNSGNVTLCLHGGEPLLAGKQWFYSFVDLVNSHKNAGHEISITIQTNAALIDNEWVDILKRENINVSLSIDGPKFVHDFNRYDSSGKGTYDKVVSNIAMLKDKNINTSAIAVLTKKTISCKPADYYQFFLDIGVSDIDITPYIEVGVSDVEVIAKDCFEASVAELERFICGLFDVWLLNKNTCNYVNIRMFEQVIAVLLGFVPTVCNMQEGKSCGKNPSIMPNGDVLACDLETNNIKLKLGSLYNEELIDILSETRLKELHSYIDSGLSRMGCSNCHLKNVCGMTCPRHTLSSRDHTGFCKLQNNFIEHVKSKLNGIALQTYGDSLTLPL